ncbi:MAG: glycosyltransferase family 4 protein [Bacteroidales bacterium]|nr:glycosyltransferase family 4 protein [Bacteroidales bacterium]
MGHSSGIATVSHALKTAMENKKLKHPNFVVVPNSVDTSRFVPGKELIKSPKKIFSHISCFDDAAKNITGIITAVDKLSRKRQDFELHIAGDGPDRAKIENHCTQLGLTGTFVFFEGLAEDHTLVEIYQKSLFTVLFSNYENMPVVIAESMACGVPVIATPVGGIPEILNKNQWFAC